MAGQGRGNRNSPLSSYPDLSTSPLWQTWVVMQTNRGLIQQRGKKVFAMGRDCWANQDPRKRLHRHGALTKAFSAVCPPCFSPLHASLVIIAIGT